MRTADLNAKLTALRRLNPHMQVVVPIEVVDRYAEWHRAWPNPTLWDWVKKAWWYYVLPNQMWRLPWR